MSSEPYWVPSSWCLKPATVVRTPDQGSRSHRPVVVDQRSVMHWVLPLAAGAAEHAFGYGSWQGGTQPHILKIRSGLLPRFRDRWWRSAVQSTPRSDCPLAVSRDRCELIVMASPSKLEGSWSILHFHVVVRLLLRRCGFTMLANGAQIQLQVLYSDTVWCK